VCAALAITANVVLIARAAHAISADVSAELVKSGHACKSG